MTLTQPTTRRRWFCTRCGEERLVARRTGRCVTCYEDAQDATRQGKMPELPDDPEALACMVCEAVVHVGREFRARALRIRMPWTVCENCEARAEECEK
jgi:hypothetical protein